MNLAAIQTWRRPLVRRGGIALLTWAFLLLAPAAAWGQTFSLDWFTIDGGGGTSSGGGYELTGTIGQSDATAAAAMSGGGFSLTGGFWPLSSSCSASVAPDLDHDCDVDAADFTLFEACDSGPAIPLGTGCEGKDFDHDGDVDQVDFAIFQRCYSGENVPANPDCAG
jgi:hypothetical protein